MFKVRRIKEQEREAQTEYKIYPRILKAFLKMKNTLQAIDLENIKKRIKNINYILPK